MFRHLPRSWRRSIRAFALAGTFWLAGSANSSAQEVVTSLADNNGPGTLRTALSTAAAGDIISFAPGLTGTITLVAPLPIISQNQTISGAGASITISGGNTTRVFFADQGAINISNLTIVSGNATGGAGGSAGINGLGVGGGGGMGAGGGLYVNNNANVTLQSVNFKNNIAVGGGGGSSVANTGGLEGGGGGGLGGAGGSSLGAAGGGGGGLYGPGGNNTQFGGGGGGGQVTAGGVDASTTTGGGGGSITTAGATGAAGGAGGAPSGGAGGVNVAAGTAGGTGGGGGGGGAFGPGGAGGTHGGGGGAGDGAGGAGGDHGGGGGGSSFVNAGIGGNGGFGGGGGGGVAGLPGAASGTGGFGGGNGGDVNAFSGGGGGSGFGGAVFVRQGGTITVIDGQLPGGNAVAAGMGASGGGLFPNGPNGTAAGGAFYLNGVTLDYITSAGGVSVIGNDIAGSGSLFKDGAGTLNLLGASTYAGPTTISLGTLLVNGSITSSVFVGPAGVLGGTGKVGPTVVDGTIAPGNNAPGRLTVTGGYVQDPGSVYEVFLNPAQHSSLIQVLGAARINGGILEAVPQPGAYTGGLRYTILTATQGESGVFDDLVSMIGRPVTVLYQGNKILLITALLPNELTAAASTFNQASVLNLLRTSSVPALQSLLFDITFQTPTGAKSALDQLSGAVYASLVSYSRTNALINGQMLFDQLGDTLERPDGCGDNADPNDPYSNGWNAWVRFTGTTGASANNRDSSGLNSTSTGILLGLDRWLDQGTRVGFYGAYNHAPLNVQWLDQTATLDGYEIGLTGSQTFGPWYAMGFAGYGNDHYGVARSTIIQDFYGSYNTGHYAGNLGNAGFEGGRAIELGDCRLQPLAGVQYLYLKQEGLTEDGDHISNLSVPGMTGDALWTSLGTRFYYTTSIDSITMEVRATARYLHDLLGDRPGAAMQLAGGGGPFVVYGARMGANLCWAGLGFSVGYRETARVFLDYNVLTSDRETIHMGTGGFEVRW